jgi:invasion protein IalB
MQVCEIAQVLSAQGQPVAQIVMGRPARGEPLQLTILVPTSVTLGQQPRLGGPGKDSPAIDLAWRRCLPGGCLAAASMSDDVAKQLRARTDATRIVYLDGSGKEAALPFSPKGLVQALDALTREEAS